MNSTYERLVAETGFDPLARARAERLSYFRRRYRAFVALHAALYESMVRPVLDDIMRELDQVECR